MGAPVGEPPDVEITELRGRPPLRTGKLEPRRAVGTSPGIDGGLGAATAAARDPGEVICSCSGHAGERDDLCVPAAPT